MRFAGVVLSAIVALTLQGAIFPHLMILGVVPDLVLIISVSVCLLKGSGEGAIIGFFSGLLEDIFLGRLLGVNAISKGIIAYVIGLAEEKVYKDNPLVSVVALLVATIADITFTFLFYKFFSALPNTGFGTYNRILWGTVLYNCILAPFVYLIYYKWLIKPKHY